MPKACALAHSFRQLLFDAFIPQTSEQFLDALRLYRQRRDKTWSLTDCSSILFVQSQGIREVLTHDRHFQQAGLSVLLR